MRTVGLLMSCVLSLIACSGGDSTPSTTNPDGGAPADGGNNADGATGSCNAAAPTVLVADFTQSMGVQAIGNDVYWIDFREGFDHGLNVKSGVVKHMKTDGSGLSTLVTPTFGALLALGVTDTELYYFSENADLSKVLLYKTSRMTGGEGTPLGSATFEGLRVVDAVLEACPTCGVFASTASDVFVNDGLQVSRISRTTGAQTILATPQPLGLFAALVGGNVYYKQLSGTSAPIFSVSASASAPGATQVGTQGCGPGVRESSMGVFSNGFVCGGLLEVDKLDLGATTKTKVYDSLHTKNEVIYEPSAVDGMTYFITPTDPVHSMPIYKVDANSNAMTPVTCDARAVVERVVTLSDFVWVERRTEGTTVTTSLRRVTR
jgi:hypothetical protein